MDGNQVDFFSAFQTSDKADYLQIWSKLRKTLYIQMHKNKQPTLQQLRKSWQMVTMT